jgi:hypothetical protein
MVLAFGFTEKLQFTSKTDQNSIFLGCKTHILDQLHIIVPHISFYGFFKKSNFGSKFKWVSLRFYRKRQFTTKTDQNSIFLGRKVHIMVQYVSFYVFYKIWLKIQKG